MEKSAPVKFASSARSINILIVDDRPENLLTLESIIEREGRNLLKASGGNEALRIAIKEEIGLIFLDIQMPDIDGLEVATLLRSNNRTRHIPIIFVSAITRLEKPDLSGFEEGTVDCLYKPLDISDTLSKVAVYEQLHHAYSEKKRLTEKVEKLNHQIDRFMYIISHDLKAPLRAIDNLTNWISDDLGNSTDTNTNENLSLMRSRVNRMSSLLEGVLEYSKSSKINEEIIDIDMAQMAHSVFESLIPPQGCKIDIQQLPVIKSEQTRIYKIFYHLINNAIIHHHNPDEGIIKITCMTGINTHTISVSDNGPGIKIQYADKIFDLFSTLKSKDEKETTGVGLSVVKKVLEDIGQSIWVESAVESGSVFSFTLPA